MIACCMSVCWTLFEIISRYLKERYYYQSVHVLSWNTSLGWNILVGRIFASTKKGIAWSRLSAKYTIRRALFEELKFSLRFVFVLTSRLFNNSYRYIPLLKSLKSHTSQKKYCEKTCVPPLWIINGAQIESEIRKWEHSRSELRGYESSR